jgi:hypothetical protein
MALMAGLLLSKVSKKCCSKDTGSSGRSLCLLSALDSSCVGGCFSVFTGICDQRYQIVSLISFNIIIILRKTF